MSSIDNRVVEMVFDNTKFGSGVKKTLDDLGKLKSGLKLDGATSGIDSVSDKVNKFSVSGMVDGLAGAAKSFSALQVAGVTALATLVNKAVDAGVRIAKSLTIDPVKAGLDSYAEQINATQVIMANTKAAGTTLPQITAALADLQAYAQQTVYNFSDMTSNIGRFTAAGVKLQPATDAIKGMANVAALSGANAEQMSGAMYQMSQALSAGTIKLQDWNSLSNANMAGQGIQDALKETAKTMGDHGKAMDAAIKKQGNFRESLTEGWLTADIYTKAMSVFGGTVDQSTGKFRAFTVEELKAKGYSDAAAKSLHDLSQDALNSAVNIRTIPQLFQALKEEVAGAWGTVFKTVFGDINQATSLFTGLHTVMENALTGPINNLNGMLTDWAKLGGRDALLDGLKNSFKALGAVIAPIKEAFRDVFPPMTADRLVAITKAFDEFTKKLTPSQKTLDNIKRTFTGLFSVIDIGKQFVSALVGFIGDLIGHFSKGSGGILDFTAKIGDFLTKIDQAVKSGDFFNKFFQKLEGFIEKPIDMLKRFVGVVASFVGSLHLMGGASSVVDKVKQNFDELSSFGDKVSSGFGKIGNLFKAMWQVVEPVLSKFGEGLGKAVGAVKDFLGGLSFNDLLGAAGVGGLVLIANQLKGVKKTIMGLFKGDDKDKKPGFLDTLKESLEGLTGTFQQMQNTLKGATLLEIAAAILALAVAFNMMSKLNGQQITNASIAIGIMIAQLVGSMKLMDKTMNKSKAMKMDMLAAGMILMAGAVDILASAAKKMADLSWDDLAKGLTGTVVLLAAVAGAMNLMPSKSKMISSGIGIVLMAEAIKMLSDSVKDLSKMSWADMSKGLTGVAALLAALGLYTKFSGMSSIGDGLGLLLMAAAIKVLASAMDDIKDLSWQDIAKGLTVTAAGLGLMAGALKLLPKDNVLQAASIVIMAAALKVLASAMEDMSKLSWTDIAKGLVGIGAGLAIITAALNLMPEGGSLLNAAALVVVTAALKILASAMADMGNMSWNEIAKSLVLLAGALTLLVLALNLMDVALPGAAALIVAAGGIRILADAMVIMGGMTWGDIAKSLVALAGALTILALGLTAMLVALPGALALIVAAPGLALLAGAFAAFGLVSWGDIGKATVGMLALFGALAIGGATAPLIMMLAAALLVLGAAIAIGSLGLLAAGEGIKAFADGMSKLAAIDSDGLHNVSGAIDALIMKIPEFATAVAYGFVDFAQVIADNAGTFGDAAGAMIDQMVRIFDEKMPELVESMWNGLDQIITTIDNHMPDIVNKGADIIVKFLEGMAQRVPDMAQAATDLIVAWLNAIGQHTGEIADAGIKMVISCMNGISTAIESHIGELQTAGGKLGIAILDGMTLGLASKAGAVIEKIGGITGSIISKAKSMLDSHSPSKVFIGIGKDVVEGFAIGLTGNKDKIDSAVGDMMGHFDDAMQTEMDSMNSIQSKFDQLYADRDDNAQKIAEAQQNLQDAINKPVTQSKAKKKADRDAANLASQQAHDKAVRSAQDSLNGLLKKQDDYNQSIAENTDAMGQARDEYWKLNAARDTLNQLMVTEQGHLDDLANQHDDLTEKIKDQTAALNDAIKTRDDYNKSLTDQLSAEAAVSKDTNLSDYTTSMTQQIVDLQQFTIAIQQLRKMGLNDTMYKQLLATGPENAMPFVQQLLDGGQSAVDNINYLGTTLDKAAGVLGTDASNSLYQAGVDAAAGLLKGLQDQDSNIQAEMQRIANYMVQSLNNALGIHSPSRVLAEVGAYSAQGLAKGLSDSAGLIGDASASAGQTAVDAMKKTIAGLGDLVNERMDLNPTIVPVLDLSNIQKGASSLNGLLGSSLSVDTSASSARDALAGYTANQSALDEAVAAANAASVTLIQNNNSPKALSQAEIYRQTNNQLSVAKGALTSNARKG